MPILGDESGDPGMGQHCSPTFTLALTLFETDEEASACEQTITKLRAELGIREFHWVSLTDKERTDFLNAVLKHNFYYVAQTLDKGKVKHRGFRNKAFFYERVAEKMAEGIEDFLRIAQGCCEPKPLDMAVVLDRNGDREYMSSMGKHLKRIKDARGRSLVGKISSHRSISYDLLQLADMVCGAVLHQPFAKIIKSKKWSELLWP
jgi:hypothetical protein